MKSHRTSYLLFAVFLTSLLAYWGLEVVGVRTERERRERETRVLPDLTDVNSDHITKVAIERGAETFVFKRTGPATGRWQIVEPFDAAAEPTRLETLVRNLKELRRSIDSGPVAGSPAEFGLEPPAAIVRLWGDARGSDRESSEPLAALEVGKVVRGVRYVRMLGKPDIQIADGRMLAAVDTAATDWREPVVIGIPTFQVASLAIKRGGQTIRAERTERGQWRLTEPVRAPANPAKIESLLSAFASLRVVDIPKGFVADNVKDFTPYGLVDPSVAVEIVTNRPADVPHVLLVGKPVPDQADRIYVRQGDQDDVVMVDARALSEIPTNATALRSQRVTEVDPSSVNKIEIEAAADHFLLTKAANGWDLGSVGGEKADSISVINLIGKLSTLQTSEFFTPDRVKNSHLDPPIMKVKMWAMPRGGGSGLTTPEKPELVLNIGRHDPLLKTVFGRLENDLTILGFPDSILDVLPKNAFAFRDLSVMSLGPADVKKLTLKRAGRTDLLEPNKAGEPNRWRLRQPVDAPADVRSVTQILALLSNLRAEQIVTDKPGDGKSFGLDRPLIEVAWEADQNRSLKIGKQVPRTQSYFAQVSDKPFVFTIKTETLKPLEAELHEHTVLNFPVARAQRIAVRWAWPPRTAIFKRRTAPAKGESEWIDEPGSDAAGIDQSRIGGLATALSQLETTRFVQYEGAIEPYTGLNRPRLTVEVMFSATEPVRVVRIGYPTGEGHVFAATGTSQAGPVFLLPSAAWDALIESGERFAPLPADVFGRAR